MNAGAQEERMPERRFGHYAAAYLDLLGQQAALRKITRMPRSADEETALIKQLRDSAGRVLMIRITVEQLFGAYLTAEIHSEAVPENHRKAVFDGNKLIRLRNFSDSIVIHVPLFVDSGGSSVPALALNAMCMATSVALLIGLAAGCPFGAVLMSASG